MDFTKSTYKSFLGELQKRGYFFASLESYLKNEHSKVFSSTHPNSIIRHDVDRLPQNSLKLAQIENSFGIKGTYYFRVVPESYDLEIMQKIANLGHEIGYHYEDVDLVFRKIKDKRQKIKKDELIDLAYESFCKHLETFRKNYDIKTICMHGSPRAKYDNKIIWEKYNYKELGLIGEPYYDIDFNEFAYFTDTGRRWNGNNVSVRDKVKSKYDFNFKTTQQIIDNIDQLPDKVMFTIHPERWHDNPLLWTKELIFQNIKNVVKRVMIKNKDKSKKIKVV
ncbi:MAG: hypothetical protein K9J12_09995 [Melioribacteraceae bacterium]|nr:hypothetical protein [Melioribacteraceae bacterium]MCF8264843.1 hypothetical protein [Melioribacteraceae bacterium]MCF8297310.1 hypothetical protein [Saprospiraceae bacterium]